MRKAERVDSNWTFAKWGTRPFVLSSRPFSFDELRMNGWRVEGRKGRFAEHQF